VPANSLLPCGHVWNHRTGGGVAPKVALPEGRVRLAPSVRLAGRDDVPAIARLSRDHIEQGLGWSWTPARVTRCLRDPQTNVAVARQGDAMLGFGIMKYRDDDAHLLLLAVQPSQVRAGVGSTLVGWLEAVAVVAGIRQISLEVRRTNEVALSFYARLGYSRVQELPGYYQGVEAAVRLAKDLQRVRVGP
jgi:ribosomal-protein-alanine N-acetyltransferase